MDATRFGRVKREYQELLGAGAAARQAAVERLCREDAELGAELARWLAAEGRRGSEWLDEPAVALADDSDLAAEEALPPERIGPWRVEAEIGRGGMGAVYRARRDDGAFEQTVAIKLVRSDLASEALRRRFLAERRILAGLVHPNIAQLIDGGTTPEGMPYLVLEHVDGEPIDRYCDSRALPAAARLRIFLVVCEAVAFAHRKLVLHRDIKPANVLVDAAGRPKLLDFGIAKLLAPTAGDADSTGLGLARPLTREWASPEQLRGDPLTTASDVYPLGLLLYHLLTGERPGRDEEGGADLRGLRGDLRRVAGRALAPAIADRYGTVGELAADVERYLDGRPVTAHPPSARYRIGKFVRRHRAGVAAAALALASLGIGGGIAIWQAGVAARERARPSPVVRYVTHSGSDAAPALAPGGDAIAFSSRRDGRQRIWVARLATGDELPLTAGEDDHPRFSPDGREILFTRRVGDGTALHVVAAAGGRPHEVFANARFGDFAPDGRQVVVVREELAGERTLSVLTVVARDGGGQRDLVRFEGRVLVPPRWSPDGGTVALTVRLLQRGDAAVIALVDTRTGAWRSLAPQGSSPRGLAWAGPMRLAFAQPESMLGWITGTSSLVFVYDVESEATRSVLSHPTSIVSLDARPTGQLVFASASYRVNLQEIDLAGGPSGTRRWLTSGHSSDRQPVYSPDGEWLVYSSSRGDHLDLWAVSPRSGATRRLTRGPALDWDPAFTAGGQLLWSSDRTGIFEVWRSASDGSDARQVTRDAGGAQNPGATADGSWVLYVSANPKSRGIVRVRPDGSQPTLLVPGSVFLPEVSPDGRHVAFLDLAGERPTLRVARIADGVRLPFALPLPLSDPAADPDLGRCRWFPDGTALAVLGRHTDGTYAVFAFPFAPDAPADVGAARLLASEPGFAAESFGISPDGQRLAVAYWDRAANLMLAEQVAGFAH